MIAIDAGVVPFKAILRYIYFGYISLANLSNQTVFEILKLADMYLITLLADSIIAYLTNILTLNNVFNILELSQTYRVEHLTEACFVFVDRYATDVLRHASFHKLSQVNS